METEKPPRVHRYYRKGQTCHYCGVSVTLERNRPNSITIDHVIPVSRGGKGRDNKVVACYQCNHEKGSLSYEYFVKLLHGRRILSYWKQ